MMMTFASSRKEGRKLLSPLFFPFLLSLFLYERRRRNGRKKEGGDENNAELGRTCNNRLTGKKEESSFIERERERVLKGRERRSSESDLRYKNPCPVTNPRRKECSFSERERESSHINNW